MSVSFGPYKSTIPFVNVEEVQLATARQDAAFASGIIRKGKKPRPGALDITVQLSNEIVLDPPPQVKIGNFVYFTLDRSEVEGLVATPAAGLINLIQNADLGNSITLKLVLDPSEFVPTATRTDFLSPDSGATSSLPIRSRKTVRTLRLPFHADELKANLYMIVASFREHSGQIQIGNISQHIILQNGRVPTTAVLYALATSSPKYGTQDSIWPGPIHEHNHKLMAGPYHIHDEHPEVIKKEIPNIKVKDMRVLTLAANSSPSYVPPNRVRPYISPLEVSRGADGIAHGMFSFDISTYISTNSSLAGIMTNQASLLGSVDIKDIIIYQKPSGQGAKSNPLTPVALTYCGLNATRDFVPVASLNNGCEILNTLDNGNSILNISFVDNAVIERGVGFAEYKVEILLVDRATEVVTNVVTQLNNMVSEANNRLVLNRERGSTRLYARTIETYLNILQYLFGNNVYRPFTKDYWQSNMLAMMYGPQQGDKEKMLLMRTIEVFIQQLNNIIQKTPMATVTSPTFRSMIGSSNKQSLLTFHHKFNNKLYLQGVKDVGLSYVDSSIQNVNSAIPQISHSNYTSRAFQEIDKYNIANSNANSVNKYGFLSPAYVGLGRLVRIYTTSLEIPNDPILSLLNSNLNTNLTLNIEPHRDPPAKRLDVLRTAGVALVPLKVTLKKKVLVPGVVNPPLAPASDYLSSNSSFYLANLEENEISGSQRGIIRYQVRSALTEAPLVATIVNQTMLNYVPAQLLSKTTCRGTSYQVLQQ